MFGRKDQGEKNQRGILTEGEMVESGEELIVKEDRQVQKRRRSAGTKLGNSRR